MDIPTLQSITDDQEDRRAWEEARAFFLRMCAWSSGDERWDWACMANTAGAGPHDFAGDLSDLAGVTGSSTNVYYSEQARACWNRYGHSDAWLFACEWVEAASAYEVARQNRQRAEAQKRADAEEAGRTRYDAAVEAYMESLHKRMDAAEPGSLEWRKAEMLMSLAQGRGLQQHCDAQQAVNFYGVWGAMEKPALHRALADTWGNLQPEYVWCDPAARYNAGVWSTLTDKEAAAHGFEDHLPEGGWPYPRDAGPARKAGKDVVSYWSQQDDPRAAALVELGKRILARLDGDPDGATAAEVDAGRDSDWSGWTSVIRALEALDSAQPEVQEVEQPEPPPTEPERAQAAAEAVVEELARTRSRRETRNILQRLLASLGLA